MSVDRVDPTDWNYWQATAAFSATSALGEVDQKREVLLVDVGAPVPQFNIAFVPHPERDLEAAAIVAREFFGAKQHPYRVVIRDDQIDACDDALRKAGLARVDDIPGMTLARIPDTPPRCDGVSFRRVDDAKTLDDFSRTAFIGFGLPERAAGHFLTEDLAALPAFEAFVGYVDGQPACTSALFETAGVAGVYWVATLEAHRGRGLGESATWAAVEAGRRRGLPYACLQASAMGRPVYTRMGFEVDRQYVRYEQQA
jgi:ribosomal protein S18 acetylase RimI-like enzyme